MALDFHRARGEIKAMGGRLFCFGLGYSARALAARLRGEGWAVAGTTRSAEKAAALEAQGFAMHLFGPGRPLCDAPAALSGASHLLISVGPDADGDPVLRAHEADIAAARPRWIGYLSTTGVYGDHAGGWVEETTPRAPASERGQRRLEAEDAWFAFGRTHGIAVSVFRLAGIYGPGRSQIDSLRAGTARRIDKPGQVFSRIHVDDIAAVLAAAIARQPDGEAFNVCDDEPAPPAEVVAHAATLLGVPPPPLEPWETAQASLSEMGRSFYGESKRVANAKIKAALGVQLACPSYREGLAACLAATRGAD